MFGWEAAEVLGKRVDERPLVYEQDRGLVQLAMDSLLHGKNCVSRNRNYRKGGSVIYCEWHNSVVVDETGVLLGGLSLVLDTTEHHRIQAALEATEEKYEQIVELAPIGIFRSTVQGRFLGVNSKLAHMFRYRTPEEMVAQVPDIAGQLFVNSEQRRDIIERAIHAGDFVQDEVEYRRRDGSTFVCNLYLRTVGNPDGPDLLEGFVEDITERRRAEEIRREAFSAMEKRVEERTAELSAANQRLQELDRLKSQFLASMSHELRTPLNSIIGFTSLLRQGLTGPINDEQRKQLEIVQTSASHLLTLINDLLDVSRIEAGRADIACEPFDFADVLHDVVRLLEPMAHRKSLDLVVDVRPKSIPMKGDRKRALQVLLNLANNAVKFTAHGGVTISGTVEGGALRVTVADTGIGIKPEHIGMLFEAFRQVDGSAKRVYEGTGLGLYLSRKLLHMMGGEIQVESEYGVGSRFSYSMPVELTPESLRAHQE